MNLSLLSQLGLENIVNNQKQLSSSLSKLSSGLKIISASDDASGLAIADKLRTQATGINQATSNANSAIAFAQIGDKAMSEQSSILDFVKEKLIQSATDTTSDDGRQMILSDIKKSLTQYDSIASSTNYNGTTILQKDSNDQGESPIHTFQVGDNPKDIVSIEVVQANTSFGGGTQIDTLNISGDIKEKDIFTVTINGIPVSYVANSSDVGSTGDKHNQVALGLKSEIESNSQLSNLITVENSSNGVLKFTSKNDGGLFNVNSGTITLDTNINLSSSGIVPAVAQQMTYSFSGTVEKGDTYSVGAVSYTVQASDTSMNNIIDKLVQGLNGTDGGLITGLNVTSTLSGATASRSLGNLVLTANTAGVPFTPPSFSTTNLPSVNDQSINMTILQNNVEAVAGNPPVYVDRLYTIINRDLTGIVSYDLSVHPVKSDSTDSFTYSSYYVQPLDTVENIRDNLVNSINSNLTTMDTKYINIQKVGTNQIRCYGFINGSGLGPNPFLDNAYVTVDIISNFYDFGTNGTQAEQQKVGYTLSGTVETGDKYKIGNITYTVQPTDTNIENIVDKLIIGLNGGTATGLSGTSSLSGVTASKDSNGMLLLTANVAGTPFTPPTYQVTNASINNQNITLVNTINNVTSGNENKYSISGFINEGNSYNIGGAIYTAQSGDTIEDVIDGLVNSVNGNSVAGVSGNPIAGVVAIKTPPPIQISIKPSTNFTISATVNLSNLTANELKNDLSINSNNVVTFNSSSGKYSIYIEDSTIDYNDETQNIDTQNLQSVNSLSGLKNLNYLTVDIAQRYMTIVDDNLTALNNFRGSFGSAQNQLESASRNLMTQYTNLKNAESVIRDVDYAEESTNFSRLNIIGQGAIYAQSKANERKEDIIRLLQS